MKLKRLSVIGLVLMIPFNIIILLLELPLLLLKALAYPFDRLQYMFYGIKHLIGRWLVRFADEVKDGTIQHPYTKTKTARELYAIFIWNKTKR